MYEKASDAEAAADSGAGDTEDEADDVETKELRRNGAAEAPSRPAACLRGRGAPPREGRSEGSAARRESMRQVEAEAKASIGGRRGSERAEEENGRYDATSDNDED